MATRSAAQTFGLDFLPLRSERYDLVMRKRTADLPAVKAFLDVLQRATLRRKLEVLLGKAGVITASVVEAAAAGCHQADRGAVAVGQRLACHVRCEQ